MSYIQLPYGLVKKSKQIQFNLPKNYVESQYINRLPSVANKGPDFNNRIINLLQNREDLKKWLLVTSEYGNELQEDLNKIVGYDEKFNNANVRHALDRKNAGVFQNLNPLNLTFRDVQKFDLQSPMIGKIATQVKASKLTEDQLTKMILMQDEIAKIENQLKQLKKPININNSSDSETVLGGGTSRPGSGPGTPVPGLPPGYLDSVEDMTRRLNILCSNHPPPPSASSSPRNV